jgi:hypothetical protein
MFWVELGIGVLAVTAFLVLTVIAVVTRSAIKNAML